MSLSRREFLNIVLGAAVAPQAITPQGKPPITKEFIEAIFRPHPAQEAFFNSKLDKMFLFGMNYGMSGHRLSQLIMKEYNVSNSVANSIQSALRGRWDYNAYHTQTGWTRVGNAKSERLGSRRSGSGSGTVDGRRDDKAGQESSQAGSYYHYIGYNR